MPAGRLQISTSSTHDGGPIQAIDYINDTLKVAQDNDRVGRAEHLADLDVVEPVAKWGVALRPRLAGLGAWCVANSYRPVLRDQAFLLPPDMREWLPPDHLVWFLLDTLKRSGMLAARQMNCFSGLRAA